VTNNFRTWMFDESRKKVGVWSSEDAYIDACVYAKSKSRSPWLHEGIRACNTIVIQLTLPLEL